MQREEALRHVPFLAALSDDTLRAIAAAGREQSLCRDQWLFSENESCLGLIVVLAGAIRIFKVDGRGREMTLGTEGPGSSVAELPLFDGGAYPASAEAAEDDTHLLIVPRDRFLQLMATHPEMAAEALRAMAFRMRRLVQMVEAQALHSVRVRLATYLLRAAQGRSEFLLEETNDAIAGHLGTVRDVVSRTLNGFREEGVLALRGRQVTIQDRMRLHTLAETLCGDA